MPSDRFTKINIEVEVNETVKLLAAAQGISATQMLERIILYYLQNEPKPAKN